MTLPRAIALGLVLAVGACGEAPRLPGGGDGAAPDVDAGGLEPGGAAGFTDVTDAVGLVLPPSHPPLDPNARPSDLTLIRALGYGAAVGDYDGDGDLDLYVLRPYEETNRLYRNESTADRLRFVDVTDDAGVGDRMHGRSAVFADLDADGALDLVVASDAFFGEGAVRVWRNRGDGTFALVSAALVNPGFSRCGLALGDYDRDGLVDVYSTVWAMELGSGKALWPGDNRLVRNLGNMQFQDVTEAAGLGPPLRRDSFTALFADLGGDGWPDLYVAVDHSADEIYDNVGGVFARRTTHEGHVGNDMGIAVADLDEDDDLDLFVTNITDVADGFYASRGRFNTLLIADSTGSHVNDAAQERGVADTYWGWGAAFADLEGDGDEDLVVATGADELVEGQGQFENRVFGTPVVVFENDGTDHFARSTSRTLPVTDTRAVIPFDLDRDGDLDVLLTHADGTVTLYRNDTPPEARWLTVRLCLGVPACQPWGARVYVELVDGRRLRRDVLAGTSYLSGQPAEAHYGLGEAEIVRVRVVWPDGREQVLEDIRAGQIVDVGL